MTPPFAASPTSSSASVRTSSPARSSPSRASPARSTSCGRSRRAAYQRGAKFVDVQCFDPWVKRARIEHAREEDARLHPRRGTASACSRWGRSAPRAIGLSGPVAPGLIDDLDPARVGRDRFPALKEAGKVVNDRTTNWTIAPCPTPAWARLVYPDLPEEEALAKLEGNLMHVCRLDEEDPVAAWRERADFLVAAADRLTQRGFDALHYEGPGTDLTVGLLRDARWAAARFERADGLVHMPNIPTEEVFTSPDPARVDGDGQLDQAARATDGTVVRNLKVRFEGGRAVQIDADTAAETMRTICARDEGAARLGEIALVDREGRIGQLGHRLLRHAAGRERREPHRARPGLPVPAGRRRTATAARGQRVGDPHRLHDRVERPRGHRDHGGRRARARAPRRHLADLERRAGVRWPAQLLLVALIWGASFMFIKVELDAGLAPVHVAFLRCALGAPTLLLILVITKDRLPRDRAFWGHVLVLGTLMNAAPFALFAYGETEVSSLLAGIFNALTPLMTLLFSISMLPDEPPTTEKITGLAVGFLGVLVVLAPWRGLGGGSLLGSLACIGAATCYGAAFPYLRRHISGRPETGVAVSAAQVTIGGLLLLVFTPFAALPDEVPSVWAWLSILVLGALGTGIAYILNFNVVREAGAQTGSMVTYLVPVFAVVFGVTILGEPLSWHEPVGGALIILGVALAQGLLRTRQPSTL